MPLLSLRGLDSSHAQHRVIGMHHTRAKACRRPTTRTTASCASAASISPLHHVHVDVLWIIIAQECYMHITNESARRRSKRKSIFFKSTAIFVLSMKFSRV
jgi:hypothetical protein